MTKKRRRPESELQKKVFRWRDELGVYLFPELKFYHSITSGVPKRGAQFYYMAAEGMEKGFPDTFLPIPRGGYHGLWIELKAPGKLSTLREEQEEKIDFLNSVGYYAVVLDDFGDIVYHLMQYCLLNIVRNG